MSPFMNLIYKFQYLSQGGQKVCGKEFYLLNRETETKNGENETSVSYDTRNLSAYNNGHRVYKIFLEGSFKDLNGKEIKNTRNFS